MIARALGWVFLLIGLGTVVYYMLPGRNVSETLTITTLFLFAVKRRRFEPRQTPGLSYAGSLGACGTNLIGHHVSILLEVLLEKSCKLACLYVVGIGI